MKKDLAIRVKSDSKLFCSHVRSRTKTKSTIGALKNDHGNLAVVDKERARNLNNYFASVFTKENDENLPQFEERNITQPLEELEMTNETVEKSLSSMRAVKSQGQDVIHLRIMKEISSQIIEPLKNYSGSY